MPTSSGGMASYSSRNKSTSRPLPPGPGPLDHNGNKLLYKRSTSVNSPQFYSAKYSSSTSVRDRTHALLNGHNNELNNNYTSSSRNHIYNSGTTSYGNSRGSDYVCNTPSSKAYGSHYDSKKYDTAGSTSYKYDTPSKISSSRNTYSSDKLIKSTYPGSSNHHGSISKLSSRSSSVDSIKSNSTPTRRERESSRELVATQNRNDSCSSYDPDTATNGPHGSRNEKGNIGLSNLGNTCFMNSVLQCLLNTRELIKYIVDDSQQAKDINKTTSSMKGALMEAYAGLVKKAWLENTTQSVANPSDLKRKVERFAPRFGGYSQHDAQEFLRYFLQGLHEDVNRVKSKPKYIGADDEKEERMTDAEKADEYWRRYLNFDNSKIVDLFVGQLKSTLKCQECGHKSVTFDPFWDLSLPIPKRSSEVQMIDCLESFMREEILEGDERPTCAKCKKRQNCTKTFQIQKFPKILVLHLKRFSGERYRSKLQTKVNFDLRGLDLGKFDVKGGPVTYNLYGVSNHVGSVYSGHYTAYCKHPYKKRWYSFNDTRVGSVSESSLVSEEAYVLFYEREGGD